MKEKKPRVIVSTVGTSLLTNQIDRSREAEKTWYGLLRESANLRDRDIQNKTVKQIIHDLSQRATKKLQTKDTKAIRRLSAELNGIYGIYQNNIAEGKQDTHILIATDTEQGKVTAEVVKNYLQHNGIASVSIYTPTGLSTATTTAFTEGIDELITWFKQTLDGYRQQQSRVYFNLVGGFKSLQGYLNTIGMFYADEIIYIFEGIGSELITIPRLPIEIDKEALKNCVETLALLDAGAALDKNEVENIPEALVAEVDGKYTISTWGNLIWEECKDELLSGKLLSFDRLYYKESFKSDYQKIATVQEKVKLQETLAKVAWLLKESNGNTQSLTETGLKYSPYGGVSKIDHFRVDLSQRVSCQKDRGKLILRYYGTHERVQGAELPNKK